MEKPKSTVHPPALLLSSYYNFSFTFSFFVCKMGIIPSYSTSLFIGIKRNNVYKTSSSVWAHWQLKYLSLSFLILLHQYMSKFKTNVCCVIHMYTGSKPGNIYWMKIYLHLVFQEVVLKSKWHKTEGDLCIFVWLLFFQLLDMRFSNEKVLQKYGGSFPSWLHPWASSGFH